MSDVIFLLPQFENQLRALFHLLPLTE